MPDACPLALIWHRLKTVKKATVKKYADVNSFIGELKFNARLRTNALTYPIRLKTKASFL
jgi:hypothetical protein